MAQAVATYVDRYLADLQAFEEALSAALPDWLQQLREQASSRFAELGFPTARKGNEAWKYTNVAPIANAVFRYPFDLTTEVKPADIRRVAPWDDSWARLVFVDGHYSPSLSVPPAPNTVRVASLVEALLTEGDVLERHLTRYAAFENDGFTALNTAFLSDGAFVHVPDGESLPAPLHLIFLSTERPQPTVSYPRTLIVAGTHSRLTVIETYVGLSGGHYFTDAVTEIVVGDGAQVDHYRLLLDSVDAFHVGTSRVYQGRDSTFSSTSFAKGAAIGRNDFQVLLDGPGSSCFLHGLYMTTGGQHVDNYINIDHLKPHTTSRLYYKGILDGKSHAVFGGIVLVRPGAVKADAEQKDKNLILSEGAEVDSKPSLEIYADDVKCGHGATAGTIADDAIFYMRSRGLDLKTATLLLIKGFASEITDTVKVQPLRAYLERLIAGALPALHLGVGAS